MMGHSVSTTFKEVSLSYSAPLSQWSDLTPTKSKTNNTLVLTSELIVLQIVRLTTHCSGPVYR